MVVFLTWKLWSTLYSAIDKFKVGGGIHVGPFENFTWLWKGYAYGSKGLTLLLDDYFRKKKVNKEVRRMQCDCTLDAGKNVQMYLWASYF